MPELHAVNRLVLSKDKQTLSFLFDEQDSFSSMGYKVLKNQKQNGLLECCMLTLNGKTKLVYPIASLIPLSEKLHQMNTINLLECFLEIIRMITGFEGNGFILLEQISFQMEYIFFDENNKIYFLYLPAETNYLGQTRSQDIVIRLLENCSESGHISNPEPLKEITGSIKECLTIQAINEYLITYLNNKAELKTGEKIKYIHKAIKKIGNKHLFNFKSNRFRRNMMLTGCGEAEGTDLFIDKPEYIIGKKPELADGVIRMNPTISRQHCKVIFRDGKYYLCDMGSANGTFINGIRMNANIELEINQGDEIGISNSRFLFQKEV